jgi:putative redox protein
MNTILTWQKELLFNSVDSYGKSVVMDGNSKEASSPMVMLLHAVAGCSAADVILILEKMHQAVSGLQVLTEGTRAPEGNYPRPWSKIHLRYRISGPVEKEKAEKAVALSMEKYCSVSAMLSHDAQITWDVEMEG